MSLHEQVLNPKQGFCSTTAACLGQPSSEGSTLAFAEAVLGLEQPLALAYSDYKSCELEQTQEGDG